MTPSYQDQVTKILEKKICRRGHVGQYRVAGNHVRCRACEKIALKRYRVKHQLIIRERNRLRNAKRRKNLVYRKGAQEKSQQYRLMHPEKRLARQKLQNAVSRGQIIRPKVCGRCSAGGRIEAHHPDYSKPLDVIWLCIRCHNDTHHPLVATVPSLDRPISLSKRVKSRYERGRLINRQIYLTYKGETKSARQWAEEADMSYGTLFHRVRIRGWSVQKALETPINSQMSHLAQPKLKITLPLKPPKIRQ